MRSSGDKADEDDVGADHQLADLNSFSVHYCESKMTCYTTRIINHSYRYTQSTYQG